MPANITNRIKQRRKELALSQAALAKACEVGQSTVANWERGGHIPRQATLHKIAAALKTDETWLLSGTSSRTGGSLAAYMSRPIRHVPIYDWPVSGADLDAAQPRHYIPITTDDETLFALLLTLPQGPFSESTVLAFTKNYNPGQKGWFLDTSKGACRLSQTHSESCEARLTYSQTTH